LKYTATAKGATAEVLKGAEASQVKVKKKDKISDNLVLICFVSR